MKAFVVKTTDGYLCPKDGGVGWTANLDDAGHFNIKDEASDTAELAGYASGEFEIVPVEVEHLNRN